MPGVTGDYPVFGVPAHVENWATVITAVGAAAALVFCLRHARTRKSPVALYLFVGAALTIFIEPFPDVLGKAVFAEADRIPWMGGLGRQIPMFVGLIYMFYLTPAYVLLIDAIHRGITARRLATVYGGLVTAACAFEFLPLHYDLWRYYGSQGVQIGDMPIWWAFINVHAVVATAVALSFLLKLLPAHRAFLVIPLMPPLFLATHTGGAMFGYATVGTTNNPATTTIGTLATCVLCVALIKLYTVLVCRPAEAPVPAPAPPVLANA